MVLKTEASILSPVEERDLILGEYAVVVDGQVSWLGDFTVFDFGAGKMDIIFLPLAGTA